MKFPVFENIRYERRSSLKKKIRREDSAVPYFYLLFETHYGLSLCISDVFTSIFFIWFVRLLALRPLLAYCDSLGWWWRWLWRRSWNVDWQGKPKFSDKTCPSATFVHHKIPHDQTPNFNPGRRDGKHSTNRLSYVAATWGEFICIQL
jgi:hypothetical protein